MWFRLYRNHSDCTGITVFNGITTIKGALNTGADSTVINIITLISSMNVSEFFTFNTNYI